MAWVPVLRAGLGALAIDGGPQVYLPGRPPPGRVNGFGAEKCPAVGTMWCGCDGQNEMRRTALLINKKRAIVDLDSQAAGTANTC